MATDQKGIERAGIGIFHRRMLGKLAELPQGGRADPQQPAHLAGPVDRPGHDPFGPPQGVKLTFGLRPEVEGRGWSRNTSKTAGESRWRVQSLDPHPCHSKRRIVASWPVSGRFPDRPHPQDRNLAAEGDGQGLAAMQPLDQRLAFLGRRVRQPCGQDDFQQRTVGGVMPCPNRYPAFPSEWQVLEIPL